MDNRNNISFSNNQQPRVITLLVLGFAMFACSILGFGIGELLGNWWGVDSATLVKELSPESAPSDRNFLRVSTIFNQLLTFLVPALFFAIFFYKTQWSNFLRINYFPKLSNLFYAPLLVLAALPLVLFTSWINLKIPLPDWANELEELTANLVENLLIVQEPYELWFNIFVVAVIPAIAEEFLFRGVIQQKLINWMKNPHVAIWVAAIIFSAIHMQFEGFLPRVFLGAVLGYLFYWTGNLWVAVFAHFVNNALSIIAQYLLQTGQIDTDFENTDEISWINTFISLAVFLFLSYLIQKNNNKLTAKDLIA